MDDKWMLKGAEFANCNCAFGCPCQFSAPTTNGFCEAVSSAWIDEGYFNDTVLDGTCFVMLLHWPGEIAEGNGKQQLIIHEKTTQEQREAIIKISSGESTAPGSTHFFVFNSTMTEIFDPIYAPIDMAIDVEGRRAHCNIEGVVDSKGTPMINPFSGEESRARIHLPGGFEYTYAEMGIGNSKVTSTINLDLTDSYGQFNELHMNQDGVIR